MALLGTGLLTMAFAFLDQEPEGEQVDRALGIALAIKMMMYGTVSVRCIGDGPDDGVAIPRGIRLGR